MRGRGMSRPTAQEMSAPFRRGLVTAQVRLHNRILGLVRAVVPVEEGVLLRSIKSVPSSPESAAEALKPSRVVSDAAHAGIVDAGPRRNRHPYKVRRKNGTVYRVAAGARVIGSRKAPLGITTPVKRAVEAEVDGIVAKALADAGGEE